MFTIHLDHVQRAVIVEMIARMRCNREELIKEMKGNFEVFGEYTSAFSRIERKVNEEDLNEAIDTLIEMQVLEGDGDRVEMRPLHKISAKLQ